MIDFTEYYRKRKEKALEDDREGLALSYVRLELIERIAQSGALSQSDGEVLTANIGAQHLHAGGAVAECSRCGCLIDTKWDFCARCGVHFVDFGYINETSDSDD